MFQLNLFFVFVLNKINVIKSQSLSLTHSQYVFHNGGCVWRLDMASQTQVKLRGVCVMFNETLVLFCLVFVVSLRDFVCVTAR